jgi:GTP pyrophosphokinase
MSEEYTIDLLVKKILETNRQYDLSKIVDAYDFAELAHDGQKRSSGEPYITHPLAVATYLLDLGMDTDTICVALLHDVVEDTDYTLNDIRKKFGQDVAILVDGVTKLNKIPMYNKQEQHAENIRKIFLAMSQDIRVMIIKLCDRLHNMRTLKFLPAYKQRRIARETMDIYAPIAHRLGIKTVKEELEDLAFRYLDPYAYSEIENILVMNQQKREEFIKTIKQRVEERLSEEEFTSEPEISGRVKSIYGIYKKLYIKQKEIDEIYDKYAIRIIVDTVAECYNVLGIIHDMFKPIPNRFKDYISTPKSNMYQSLHTTVIGKEGIPFEVQIRTWEMHRTAEYGVAAHWKYKEGIHGKDKMEQRLSWVRQLIEAQMTSDDVEEIFNTIKSDLVPDDVVIITPKGDSITLPNESTVIDFAYRIHTEIGHKLVGAKVDGKMVALDYKLKTGEICDIITSKDPNKGPNRNWLNIVKTNEARSKIRSWFKKERREENIETGRDMLEKEFKRNHIRIDEAHLAEFLSTDLKKHNCNTIEDFYASIGYGGIVLSKIIPHLRTKYEKEYAVEPEETSDIKLVNAEKLKGDTSQIILDEISSCSVKYSQCCNPLPGDEIVGFITRGHGLSIHTKSCTNYVSVLKRNNPEEMNRWVEVSWTNRKTSQLLPATIEILSVDRVGLVFDITKILMESHIQILHQNSRSIKNGNAICELTIHVMNAQQLSDLLLKLEKIKGVISVKRPSEKVEK